MLYCMVTAGLKDVVEAYQVALDIDIGIGDAISDTCLSCQVDYDLGAILREEIADKLLVGNVTSDELECRILQQLSEALLLQADIVVVVHAINADNNVLC